MWYASRKRLLLVEFHDGKPYSAVWEDSDSGLSTYDVDYCRYYDSIVVRDVGNATFPLEVYGSTSKGISYWAATRAEVVEVTTYGEKLRRLKRLPRKYAGGRLFDDALEPDGYEWCNKCNDIVLSDDLCEHIDWCDRHGMYCKPGDVCCHLLEDGRRLQECRLRKGEVKLLTTVIHRRVFTQHWKGGGGVIATTVPIQVTIRRVAAVERGAA